MNILESKSIEEILESYEFPHRFYVKYSLAVARLANTKHLHPAVVKCLDLVQLWLDSNGNSTVVTDSELRDAAFHVSDTTDATARAAVYAVYAVYDAVYAVAHAASAAYAAYAAADASKSAARAIYAAYYAQQSGVTTKVLKSLLFDMLQTEFSELECLLLGLD